MVMSLAYGFVLVWVGCFVDVFAGRVFGGLGVFNVLVAMFGMGISVFAPGVFGVCVIGWWLFWVLFGLVCVNLVGAHVG